NGNRAVARLLRYGGQRNVRIISMRLRGRADLLAHRALFALLILFALDTERGLGTGFEALLADRVFADLADPERAVRDLLQREVELRQQALLATAEAELERLEVLAGRQ